MKNAKQLNNAKQAKQAKQVNSISELIAKQNALDKEKALKRAERKSGTPRECYDLTVFHYVKQDGSLSGGVRIVLHKGAKDKMSTGDVQELTKRNTYSKEYAKAMITAIETAYKDAQLKINHSLQANKACRAAYVKKFNTTKVTNW